MSGLYPQSHALIRGGPSPRHEIAPAREKRCVAEHFELFGGSAAVEEHQEIRRVSSCCDIAFRVLTREREAVGTEHRQPLTFSISAMEVQRLAVAFHVRRALPCRQPGEE